MPALETPYLERKEVLDRYKIGDSTLYDWQASDRFEFPKPITLVPGGRKQLWRLADLEKWEASRFREAHKDEAAKAARRRKAA